LAERQIDARRLVGFRQLFDQFARGGERALLVQGPTLDQLGVGLVWYSFEDCIDLLDRQPRITQQQTLGMSDRSFERTYGMVCHCPVSYERKRAFSSRRLIAGDRRTLVM
jgi:hypothetical protein